MLSLCINITSAHHSCSSSRPLGVMTYRSDVSECVPSKGGDLKS